MGLLDRLYTKRNADGKLNLPDHKEKKCYHCNVLSDRFLFKCKRCNHYFCELHRLPEQHDCIGLPSNVKKLNNMVNSIMTDNEREQIKRSK